MNNQLTDPLVLICGGVLLIGFVFLIWAMGKIFKKTSASTDDFMAPPEDAGALEATLPQPEDLPARRPERPAPTPVQVTAPAPMVNPAATKEVADRLDTMAQRLSDMQSVLAKQAAAGNASAGATASPAAQGFSPETIDKLLKIIGNVIQQVDILQKSIDVKPSSGAPAVSGAPAPTAPSHTGAITGSAGLRGAGGPITGPQPGSPPSSPKA